MKNVRLWYQAKAELRFHKTEVELLILTAQNHYDYACQCAGRTIEEGALENGFIAQLKMRRGRRHSVTVVWSFRQIDTALKVLEMGRSDLARALSDTLYAALKQINAEQERLNK